MNDHTVESASARAAGPAAASSAPARPAPDKTYGYSRLFGTFYERGSALEQRINTAKTKMGESAVKNGFTCLSPGARAEVIGTELIRDPLVVHGIFEGTGLYRHEASGQEYVRVRLRNEDGLSSVSVPLDSDLGKSIARHLANPVLKVGAPLSCQAFASTRISEFDGRAFANHAAVMWQDQNKIEEISKETLLLAKEEMRAKLASVGIDAKTARAALYRLETDWHRERLREAIARFEGRAGSESTQAEIQAKQVPVNDAAVDEEAIADRGAELDVGR